MYSSKKSTKRFAPFFLSWHFLLIKVLALAVVSIYLTKPTGSIAGSIAIEQALFHLYTSALDERQVTILVTGPRGNSSGESSERAVWVKQDGTFRLEQLPVGEYQLCARAPGFSDEYINDVFVDDGKTTRLSRPVKLNIAEPRCSLSSNSKVYTTKEPPFLWANVTSGKHLSVSIYRKDFTQLMKSKRLEGTGYRLNQSLSLEKTWTENEKVLFPGEKPIYQFEREVSFEESQREELHFEKPLPPGDYVVWADALTFDSKKHVYAATSFTVTDIGVIVKKAPDKTLVRALNLNTLKPVKGASVRIFGTNSAAPLAQANTDKDGFAVLAPREQKDGDHTFSVVATYGLNHAYDGMYLWSQAKASKYTTYFYTDRPIYRLGQEVFFKGIVRSASSGIVENPGQGLTVGVQVDSPDGAKLSSCNLTTNDHGTFHGSCKIPGDQRTGSYQIALTMPDGKLDYESFSVEQYRKPEFQVEVTPLTPRVVEGTPVQMRIKASYYFGAPVANARVEYSIYSSANYGARYAIMPRPSYYKYFDDWGDDDESRPYSYDAGGGDFQDKQFVQTDANGEATITVDTSPAKTDSADSSQTQPYDGTREDKSYRVDADVTDLTRMTVSSSGSVLVTPANFELFVTPSSYVSKVGENCAVDCAVVDYDGKPVANQQISLKMVRYLYDRNAGYGHEYRGVDVKATAEGTTGPSGIIKASFSVDDHWPCDTFYVIAEGRDSNGHLARGSTSVWIANDRLPYLAGNAAEAQKQPFDIKLDKKVYKQGDVAKIMVAAPLEGNEGVEALVTVEGRRIYDYKLVALNATARLVEVPIKPEYVPNAYITVSFVGKEHQFFHTQKMIRISPEENFLNVTISSNKQKYKVGENVNYTIKATHLDGSPAPNTELSLGVVDESIYAVMADATPDIQKFFFPKRENLVSTSSSFPREYSGGPDKEEPHLRKDFRDTAGWIPEVRTDSKGIAVATIKLPDNVTTWRATVRGVDLKTDVGAAIQKITVTQDLIVRLGLPRFFTQDDQGTISAVVHNYTDQPQSVKLTFSLSPELVTQKPLIQTLNVPPDKAARIDWPVTAVLAGKCTVKVKAVGQTAGDAIEQTIGIRPLGISAFSVKAGLLTDTDTSVDLPVGISGDTVPGSVKYQLSLASSSIGPVLGNFNSLIDYPYGCTEQTLSRMVPSVVAFKLHTKLGLPLSKKDEAKFDRVYADAITKLDGYRHPDGGWGWWQNDESQPYLTCLVVDGLNLMNSCNRYADTHSTWLNGAIDYLKKNMEKLQKQLSDPHLVADSYIVNENRCDMCFTLYTIGLFQPLPKVQTDWICSQYQKLPPEALAYLTMALKKDGRLDDANRIYSRLIWLANTSDQFVDWDQTKALMKRLSPDKQLETYTYRFTGVESTALALRAVLMMEPENTKRIEAIKQWLLLQRSKDGWENTKTTAEVFEALLQEELQAKSKWPTNFTTNATLAEKLLAKYTFNAGNAYQAEKTIDVRAAETQGSLNITKHGTGRLYYSSLMTCFRKLKAGDVIAEKSSPAGLKISRKFFHVVPGPMKKDGSIHFRTMPITDGHVKAGETILMKVYVESPVAIPYVMLEAALPSGAEAVDKSPEEGAMDNGDGSGPSMEGDWEAPWWSHQDVLDDRIAFFGTTLPAGKSEFHTLLRMEIPGKLNIEPLCLEGMYTKKVRAYSQLDGLTVTE
jgi:alpha-2-macroglobulin